MFTANSQDGVHESLVFVGQMENDVFESVFRLPLDGQDVAQVSDVVLPKHFVLTRLYTMEYGLHGNHWQALAPHAFCILVRFGTLLHPHRHTLFCPFFAALPYLLFVIPFTNNSILFAIHAYQTY